MRYSRHLGAFFAGWTLYSVAALLSAWVTGRPWLDGAHGLPDRLGEAALYLLLLFALALGWGYLTLRPTPQQQRRGRRPSTPWCVAGLGLAWLVWLLYGAIVLANDPPPADLPFATLLFLSLGPLLWGVLSGLAVLAGILLADRLVRRPPPAVR